MLPPGFLDELRSRLSLSEVAGRKVVWDKRKSNPGKGDWWAPCPFHQERTPSFHVDDRKGFYYCFGCQAKGDLIGFVKESENLSFMEAVERLAAEAGMEVPRERDPQAGERRARESRLAEVMERAVKLYTQAFRAGMGAKARAYAEKRGLDQETLRRFEIGYAPDARTRQAAHFREAGLLDEAIAAGILARPEDGGEPYDRFRDRLMFPIRDPRGRCIAFGGRALSPEARAKYLNSPETELFSKGRTLYNHGPARERAGKAGPLVVAEGYLDVIALDRAGFAAVAPLGTAITEDQLRLIWKIDPEPVIALDGDKAGLRAARALIDLALPGLGPGRSLGFCLMPEGQDPDDLLRAQGPEAVQALIGAPVPLIEMLWQRELGERAPDTPEARAAFDARLRAALSRIGDPSVRTHYAEAVRERRRALFRGPERGSGQGRAYAGRGRWRQPEGAAEATRRSGLARGSDGEAATLAREAAILLLAAANPQAAAPLATPLEDMPLETADLEGLRAVLLDALAEEGSDPWPAAEAALGAPRLKTLQALAPLRALAPLARDPAQAEPMLAEMIARHAALTGARREFAEARADLAEAEGEDWTWRARQAGELPQRVDGQALKDSAPDAEAPSAIERMLADAAKGTYARKNRRSPS
ncbi:MAG: DNA primase [Pseudomonadota bacterium]